MKNKVIKKIIIIISLVLTIVALDSSNVAYAADHDVGEVISEAQGFIKNGKKNPDNMPTINSNRLSTMSSTIFNIFLTIGIVAATAIAGYLGIQFMLASAADKAKVKESIIPFIIGCVIVFGAFGIWKIFISLAGGLE